MVVTSRVKYDMELVPYVNVNRDFLKAIKGSTANSSNVVSTIASTIASTIVSANTPTKTPLNISQQRRSSRLRAGEHVDAAKDHVDVNANNAHVSAHVGAHVDPACTYKWECQTPDQVIDYRNAPLEDESSVLWIPTKRSEWDDSVSEMTAVCTSATLRKHVPKGGKPFVAPLSEAYIRDRVDIDDPLNGYQIRYKSGGWLQGFIMWTNFTTWTYFFRWDSEHPLSGVPASSEGNPELYDVDGSLARDLDQQPRSGDPSDKGIVFQTIAEIGLLGGLGCGELLLRMALDAIRNCKQYKYVVLQATNGSRKFYERLGFRRVGAVCRYGKHDKDVDIPPTVDSAVQGYRHWTHSNESQKSLDLHGGPSYMMCLDLSDTDSRGGSSSFCEPDPDPHYSTCKPESTLTSFMMKYQVNEKPSIRALGSATTSTPKKRSRGRMGLSIDKQSPLTISKISAPGDNRPYPVLSRDIGQIIRSKRVYTSDEDYARPAKRKRRDGPNIHGKEMPSSPQLRRVSTNLLSAETDAQRTTRSRAVQDFDRHVVQRKVNHNDARVNKNGPKAGSQAHAANKLRKPALAQTTSLDEVSADKANEVSPSTDRVDVLHLEKNEKGFHVINKRGFVKQKVKSYPRDRVHYYNKVVRPKTGKQNDYYFVLNYNESEGSIRIVPMAARGKLSGKREGRPRYQCVVGDTDENFSTVVASNYEPIPAFMVMKTPLIAQEAWDILL